MKPKNKKVIVAKSVESVGTKTPHQSAEKLAAEVCYYYPVYSLSQARRLPAKDVVLLLSVARKKKTSEYLELLYISASPHTRKGQGVNSLADRYKGIINGK